MGFTGMVEKVGGSWLVEMEGKKADLLSKMAELDKAIVEKKRITMEVERE